MNIASKRFILLVNSAPLSREYFTLLGNHLEEQGAIVGYALDSHLSDVTSGDYRPVPGGRYFTDYCRDRMHDNGVVLNEGNMTWSSLLSDFDRFLTYKMTPPLSADSPLDFADIVVLLENFFEAYFDEFKPDAVVYEPVSNSFAIAAYRAAVRRNIPFFSLSLARIPGHIEISPTGFFHDHETVGRFLDRIRRDGPQPHSRAIAQDYITNIDNKKPDYMLKGGDGAAQMAIGLTGRYLNREKWERLKSVLTYRSKYKDDMKLAYQVGDPLLVSWLLFRRSLERRLKFRTVANLYQSKPKAARYFLYPLHYHPEASSSVLAPDYIDEMNVIKSIAFRLPLDVKLVVKEHPSATALQPLSFYRDLDAMPNVELVSPDLNPKSLAREAVGVITLTSTLGFEAAALNKPVICLGDVLFGYFPNVRMIQNYSDLDDSLAWALDYEPLEPEAIVEAMTAYVEYCDPGSFSFKGSLKDPSAIANVARLLLDKLELYKEPVFTLHRRPDNRAIMRQPQG